MKRGLIVVVIVLVVAAGIWYAVGGGEKGKDNHLGQQPGTQVTAVGDIQKAPNEYLGKVVTVEGTLTKECPSSGCWWYVKDATGEIRADSFGAGFALPLHQEGRHVRTTGKIVSAEGGGIAIAATGAQVH